MARSSLVPAGLSPSLSSVWQAQLTQATKTPWLLRQLTTTPDLLPRFTHYYERLSALPRKTRRALQSKLARSLAGAALLLALSPQSNHAATFNVAASDEAGFVAAVAAANDEGTNPGADTIVLTNSTFSFLTYDNPGDYGYNALPVITSEIVIEGNGSTIERGAGATQDFRFFQLTSSGSLTIEDATISGGTADVGGAIFNSGGISGSDTGGTLTLTNSTLSGNSAAALGGAIFNGGGVMDSSMGGTVTLNHSTLSGNNATTNGGGIFNGGGISDSATGGTVSLTNATLSGNTATNNGGGIYNDGGNNDSTTGGTVTLTNSTLSGNDANDGGGIFNDAGLNNSSTGGNVTLIRSLVSGNTAGTAAEVYNNDAGSYPGTITAANDNVFGHYALTSGQAFSGFLPDLVDDVNATAGYGNVPLSDILDSTLANNGGPTQTHALIPDAGGTPTLNPALNRVACGLADDQRGYLRDAGLCDSGAFELNGTPPSTDPCATATPTDGCRVDGVPNQPCQADDTGQTVVGTSGPDIIFGGSGADRLRGLGGDDLLCGFEGNDILVGGSGGDTIVGHAGEDKLQGQAGGDFLFGGPDNDTLAGGGADDELNGEGGDDLLQGNAGNDTLNGGDDNDELRGGGGDDILDGEAGTDDLNGGPGQDMCGNGTEANCELPLI